MYKFTLLLALTAAPSHVKPKLTLGSCSIRKSGTIVKCSNSSILVLDIDLKQSKNISETCVLISYSDALDDNSILPIRPLVKTSVLVLPLGMFIAVPSPTLSIVMASWRRHIMVRV